MAKVTWLGSPDSPDELTWAGRVFKKGQAVDEKDEGFLRKADGNRFFKVEGFTVTAPEDPVTYRPPSEQSAQGPVPKGGEPIMAQPGPPPDELAPVAAKTEGHHPSTRRRS